MLQYDDLKRMNIFLSPCILLFLLVSCGNNESPESRRSILPQSNGTHNEMMVVMDEELWEGALGSLIRDRLMTPYPGLPQNEPTFALMYVRPEIFQSRLFNRTKSIVSFEVISDSTAALYGNDLWAYPQYVARFIAPGKLELAKLFEENRDLLIEKFQKSDMEILKRRLVKTEKPSTPEALEKFGIEKMMLGELYQMTLNKDSLVIFRYNTTKINRVMFFHIRPIDSAAIPGADIVAARDSILKHYFEGPTDGSYPGTEMRTPPSLSHTTIGGYYATELRGLWRTYGDFMGGPFLTYEIYLDDRNTILTVDAFVYGAGEPKLKHMMEMELYMRSMEF